jgi:primase-polymerase (primpol)-like protein
VLVKISNFSFGDKPPYGLVPAELKERPQWINWRYKFVPGRNKAKKPPIDPRSGVEADVTSPATWATFDEACEAHQSGRWSTKGIGFVFTPEDPYFGLDLDGCLAKPSGIAPWASSILDRLQTYTEWSPSGEGVHAIGRGRLACTGRKIKGIEIYDRGRYFTFTGEPVAGRPLEVRDMPDLEELVEELFGKAPSRAQNADYPRRVVILPPEDKDLILRALSAKNGPKFSCLWRGRWKNYKSRSEADQALAAIVMFWTRGDRERAKRIMCASGLYRRKYRRKDYLDRCLDKAYWPGRSEGTK